MTVVDIYVSEDSVADAAGLTTGNYDERVTIAVNASARAVDAHCGRSFYLGEAATTRVYHADDCHVVRLPDDWATITAVKTDTSSDGTYATTWATTDYQAEPLNGIADGITGWPITGLRAVGNYGFPVAWWKRIPSLQVTGTPGWAAVPYPVQHSSLIIALALLTQTTSPGGIVGQTEFGNIRLPSNVVMQVSGMLAPYRRGAAVLGMA